MDLSGKNRRCIEIRVYEDGHVEYEIDGKKQVFQAREPTNSLFNIIDVILRNFFVNLAKEPDQLGKKKSIGYIT